MALSWNTLRGLPRLRTYKDASDREANTKPIRGDKQGLKPLGNRSQKWRHIRREADGTITITETNCPGYPPLITFYLDDTVSIMPPPFGNKATGHDVINQVLGMHVSTEAGDSWVGCVGGTYRLRPRVKWNRKTEQYETPEGEHTDNRFKWDAQRGWIYLNPPKPTVHVIDRKGAKAVRERYAAFSLYLSAMSKLRKDSKPDFEEYVEVFGATSPYSPADKYAYKPWWAISLVPVINDRFDHVKARELADLMASDKPEDQYKAFMWLSFRHWGSATKAMEKVLLMHHHDEMLTPKEREPGSKSIDRYKWAIPANPVHSA